MLKVIFTYLAVLVAVSSFAQGSSDTIRVYFDRDVDSLNVQMQGKIDSLFRRHKLHVHQSVAIIGYTDYIGSAEYNDILSKERARNVAYNLLGHGMDEKNISLCIGEGKIDRKGKNVDPEGYPTDRRVDIVITSNGIAVPKGPPKKEEPKASKRDTGDVVIVMHPGKKRTPIPPDMRNIPVHPPKVDTIGLKHANSKDLIDTGNIFIVMRPGKKRPPIPADMRNIPLHPKENTSTTGPKHTGDITDIATYKPGETYVLKNIYFLPQSHYIREESTKELEKLYKVMADNGSLKIQIEGHVCCIIDYPDAFDVDAQDSHLSVNRARFIYEYLLKKGIGGERLKYIGYGKSRPVVAIEKSEDDANKNRRVEIRILEK